MMHTDYRIICIHLSIYGIPKENEMATSWVHEKNQIDAIKNASCFHLGALIIMASNGYVIVKRASLLVKKFAFFNDAQNIIVFTSHIQP